MKTPLKLPSVRSVQRKSFDLPLLPFYINAILSIHNIKMIVGKYVHQKQAFTFSNEMKVSKEIFFLFKFFDFISTVDNLYQHYCPKYLKNFWNLRTLLNPGLNPIKQDTMLQHLH